MLGEMAFHYGGQVAPRVPARFAFDAFAKALELDSVFAPAYEHIVSLALRLQDQRMARKLASPEAPSPTTAAFLDSAKARRVWDTWFYIQGAVDSGEATIAAARAFTRSRHAPDSLDTERQERVLPQTLAYRGHLQEARRELWAHRPWKGSSANLIAGELLMQGAVSPDSAASWLESLLHDGSLWSPVGLAWWSARGDSGSLHRLEQLARSKSRSAPAATGEAAYWTYQAATVPAYLALARRDTSLALSLLAGLSDTLCRYCYFDRLLQAQILSERKQDAEAAALLNGPLHDYDVLTPSEVPWALLQARLNERLGNRDKAVECYSFVAAAWREADQELQPLVTEAREGVARLSGEVK
jgi:hypothetical protein